MDFFGFLTRKSKQTPNAAQLFYGSQNVGAKLHVREGISPDRNLRSLNVLNFVGILSSSSDERGSVKCVKGGGDSQTTRRFA